MKDFKQRRRIRRAPVLLVVSLGVMLGLAAEASAATVSTGSTAYQTATIAAAVANNQTGVRVAPAVVEWNHGDVVMTVPATPQGSVTSLPTSATSASGPDAAVIPNGSRSSCPSGISTFWSCVYNQTNFNGTRLEFKDTGYYQDLHSYGGTNWITLSWVNTAGHRVWLNQYANHSNPGAELCMTGGGAGSNSFGPWSADEWIYLSTNNSHC